MSAISKYNNKIFYGALALFTFMACFCHISVAFIVGLYIIMIGATLLLDDTKCVCLFFYCACFMSCFQPAQFLIALNVCLVLFEIKKFYLARKNHEQLKKYAKVFLVWGVLLVALTIYSLIVNKFKIYRMGMVIDFVQCCLVYYLVKDDLKIKDVAFTLLGGIICSVAISALFNICGISNANIAGKLGERFGAFFNNINTLAVYCTLCASTFVVLLSTGILDIKKYFALPFVCSAIGLLTMSKAFILLNILLYAAWFGISFIKSKNKKIYIVYGALGLVAVAIVAVLARNYIKLVLERFTDSGYNSVANNLTTGRVDIWKQYLKRWLKSPLTFLFGNGYTAPKIPIDKYEHSVYVAFLYQFGIIGSALIVGVLIWTVKQSKLSKNIYSYIPLGLLLVNAIVSNLSGVLCTCLIWFMAFTLTKQCIYANTEQTLDTNTEQKQDTNTEQKE